MTLVATVRGLLAPVFTTVSERQLQTTALGLLVLCACLGTVGGTWDAAWHVTLRRENFWTPPHLLLYSGTALALLSALTGALNPWARGKSIAGLDRGFIIAAAGAAIVIGAAPLDDFWHRTFGADVDVWSFPHLVAIGGGAAINVGSALVASGLAKQRGGDQVWKAAAFLFLTALLWIAMFSLNWYTLVLARVRDSLEYPLLAVLLATPVLILSSRLLGRGGATMVAAYYMGYTAAAHQILAWAGFAHLPFPPIVVVPAIAVDLLWSERPSLVRGLAAGGVAGALFVLAEAASLAWYPHAPLQPPRSATTQNYYDAAAQHPWDAAHLAITIPLCIGVGAIAGLSGTLLSIRLKYLAGARISMNEPMGEP